MYVIMRMTLEEVEIDAQWGCGLQSIRVPDLRTGSDSKNLDYGQFELAVIVIVIAIIMCCNNRDHTY